MIIFLIIVACTIVYFLIGVAVALTIAYKNNFINREMFEIDVILWPCAIIVKLMGKFYIFLENKLKKIKAKRDAERQFQENFKNLFYD